MCLGMPSVDKLMPGSTLHPISQPITRKQRFGRGHCASWLLRILHGFYLGVLEVPSTRKQLSSMIPANAPATLCFIPPTPSIAHGMGLSETTGKQLQGCSLSFWWALVSSGL